MNGYEEYWLAYWLLCLDGVMTVRYPKIYVYFAAPWNVMID